MGGWGWCVAEGAFSGGVGAAAACDSCVVVGGGRERTLVSGLQIERP